MSNNYPILFLLLGVSEVRSGFQFQPIQPAIFQPAIFQLHTALETTTIWPLGGRSPSINAFLFFNF
jgi:hypothetical protein